MAKKMLATSIEENLLQDFRVVCVVQGKKMNEVLEELMRSYVEQHKDVAK
ncbi:MAG: hypothetical protein SOV63_01195 [Pyramidobacter porci]|nr:hypothetical protein [Pyramidobacter porci]MDY2647403.1 hypothetical protein [Pyramidobacter porci]